MKHFNFTESEAGLINRKRAGTDQVEMNKHPCKEGMGII
jgi:hypothetical protein